MPIQRAVLNKTTGKWSAPASNVSYSKDTNTGKWVRTETTNASTFISKDAATLGQEMVVTPSGKVAPANPSITITGKETAADIIKQSRSIAQTYGTSPLDVQNQISRASVNQAQVNLQASKPVTFLSPNSPYKSYESQQAAVGIAGATFGVGSPKGVDFTKDVRTGTPITFSFSPVVTEGFSERSVNINNQGLQYVAYKDSATGKTSGVYTSPNIASNEPSELGWYSKIDTALRLVGTKNYNLGGQLPGGVSVEYAQAQTNKEYLFGESKGLKTRSLILGGTQMAAAATAGSFLLLTAPTIGGYLWANKIVTGGSIVAGAGAATAVMKGGKFISELSYGASEKQILSNKTQINAINQAVGLAKGKAGQEYRLSEPGAGNVIDYINYNFGGYGNSELRGKAFEGELRNQLKSSGAFSVGQEFESAVAIGKSQRVTSRTLEVAAVLTTIGGSSEGFGQMLLNVPAKNKESLTKFSIPLLFKTPSAIKGMGLPPLKYATKGLLTDAVTTRATAAIAIAGAGEGVAIDVALTQGGTLKFNPLRTAGMGFAGAYSAGMIGGAVVRQALKSQTRGGVALGAAYTTDWTEPYGDLTYSLSRNINKFVFSGGYTSNSKTVPINTYNTIFNFGAGAKAKTTKVSTKSNIFTSTDVALNVPTKVNTNINSIISFTNRKGSATTNTLSGGRRRGGVSTITNVPINPPVNPTINPVINIPINPVINVPTKVNTNIRTPTNININTPVDIPVTVQTINFPFILPGGGGSGRGFNRNFFGGRVKGSYTPSLVATAFNIRGRQPAIMSGFNIRPILGTPTKKKRMYAGGA